MQEIKFCQYCGNNELDIEVTLVRESGKIYRVHCRQCGAYGPLERHKEMAIKKWNSRIHEVPEIAKEEQVSCTCNGNEEDYHYCPIMDKSCIKDNCMMFVWTETERDGTEWGRCGLVNTMYINSTGRGT